MLTMQMFAAATETDAIGEMLGATEHATLTEAIREFEGWQKAGAVRYLVQGNMSIDCVCKRTMESRNRKIELYIAVPGVGAQHIEVKAPQACKYLREVAGDKVDTAEIMVSVSNDEFRIG